MELNYLNKTNPNEELKIKVRNTNHNLLNSQYLLSNKNRLNNPEKNFYLSPKFNEKPRNSKKRNFNNFENLNKSLNNFQNDEEKIKILEKENSNLKDELIKKEKYIEDIKKFNYDLNLKFDEAYNEIYRLQEEKICNICNNDYFEYQNKENKIIYLSQNNEILNNKINKLIVKLSDFENQNDNFYQENVQLRKKLENFEKLKQSKKKNSSLDNSEVLSTKTLNKSFSNNKNFSDLVIYYENTHQLVKCITDLAIKLCFYNKKFDESKNYYSKLFYKEIWKWLKFLVEDYLICKKQIEKEENGEVESILNAIQHFLRVKKTWEIIPKIQEIINELNLLNNMVKNIREMFNLEINSTFEDIENALSFVATTRNNP